MTHRGEIIAFPRRDTALAAAREKVPNYADHAHLCITEKLVDAISDDVQAALCNAAEGRATAGLGGVVNGRSLTWSVQLCLNLIDLRKDPADEALKQSLTQWLHGGQGNDQ